MDEFVVVKKNCTWLFGVKQGGLILSWISMLAKLNGKETGQVVRGTLYSY